MFRMSGWLALLLLQPADALEFDARLRRSPGQRSQRLWI